MRHYPHALITEIFDERQVNTYTDSDQLAPRMVTLADGTYIVVWQSAGQDGSGEGVFAQRFTATGERIGPEFQVNSQPLLSQTEPTVAALTDGGWVITWTDQNSTDGSSWGIFAQQYDANGNPVGGEFQVNTTTASTQQQPAVTGLTGGGYVISWTDPNNSGPDTSTGP